MGRAIWDRWAVSTMHGNLCLKPQSTTCRRRTTSNHSDWACRAVFRINVVQHTAEAISSRRPRIPCHKFTDPRPNALWQERELRMALICSCCPPPFHVHPRSRHRCDRACGSSDRRRGANWGDLRLLDDPAHGIHRWHRASALSSSSSSGGRAFRHEARPWSRAMEAPEASGDPRL